jgi:hypothetical protein
MEYVSIFHGTLVKGDRCRLEGGGGPPPNRRFKTFTTGLTNVRGKHGDAITRGDKDQRQ